MRFEQDKPDNSVLVGRTNNGRLIFQIWDTKEQVQVPDIHYNQSIGSQIRQLEFLLYKVEYVTESDVQYFEQNRDRWERALNRLRGPEYNNLDRGRTARL